MTKKFWQSKTIWLAVAQAVLGILVALEAQNPTLGLAGVVAVLKSSIDIYLRFQTYTEIGPEV